MSAARAPDCNTAMAAAVERPMPGNAADLSTASGETPAVPDTTRPVRSGRLRARGPVPCLTIWSTASSGAAASASTVGTA